MKGTKGKWWAGGLGLLALVGIAFFWPRAEVPDAPGVARTERAAAQGPRGFLDALLPQEEGAAPAAPTSAPAVEPAELAEPPSPAFMAARARAMAPWQAEVRRRLEGCLPGGGGDEPDPEMVPVTFVLGRDEMLSTEVSQRYQVMAVELGQPSEPTSGGMRACLDKAIGTMANLDVGKEEVPADEELLRETLPLPLL